MGRKFTSILSTLLILAGLIMPTIPVFAVQFQTPGWSVSASTVSYDYVNETTSITYNLNRADGTPHDLSHFSVATCWTSKAEAPEADKMLWETKEPVLYTDGNYLGPIYKYDSGFSTSTSVTVTFEGLWKTETKSVYLKAGLDWYQSSGKIVGCTPLQADYTITKTGDQTVLNADGTVNYSYTFTNTGDLPLYIESATDSRLGSLSAWVGQTVQPGDSLTATKSEGFTIPDKGEPDESVTNVVTVVAYFKVTNKIQKQDDWTVTLKAPPPVSSFSVSKSANPTSIKGGTVNYSYTITNTGDNSLTLVSADDNKLGSISMSPTSLGSGASATGTASKGFPYIPYGAPAESETNTFTVVMADANGNLPSQQAEATITNNPLDPLSVVAVCTDDEPAKQTWKVTNPNPVALNFSWSTTGNSETGTGSVAAGGVTTFDSPGTGATSISIYIAYEGTDYLQGSADATAVSCDTPAPAFHVEKSVNIDTTAGLQVGGEVTFTFTIVNDGNVDLTLESASDSDFGAVGFTAGTIIPKNGGSVTKTYTHSFPNLAPGDADVTHANTFTAVVSYGGTELTDDATVTFPIYAPDAAPAIQVTKDASTSSVPGTGGNVIYTYTITNTGNVPLQITEASDDKFGAIDVADFFPDQTSPFMLAAGASVSYQYTHGFPARASDLPPVNHTNVFTAVGWYASGEQEVSDDDDATVVLNPQTITIVTFNPNPNFAVTKTVSTTDDPATGTGSVSITNGGTVYYFYTLTNTGNVTLTISEAVDDKLGSVPFSPTTLTPGQSATAKLQKTFGAVALGSDPQVETNVLSATVAYGASLYGPKTASATVTNSPPPSGSVTVRVFDNSPRNNGVPKPIANADVELSNGMTGTTNAQGEILFDNLAFGDYTATGSSVDPVTGQEPQSGSGETTINAGSPDGVITILLSWTPAQVGNPPPPKPEPKGSITVLVLDGSPRNNGELKPIQGATVNVAGKTLKTDAKGTVKVQNLAFAAYTAHAEAVDPLNPADGEIKTGSGYAEITPKYPDEQITIVLMWDPPLASAVAEQTGSIAGRICAPRAPGAELVATDSGGRTVKTFVAATGKLGVWLDYVIENVAAGTWTLTLNNPGDAPAQQTITVKAGEAAQASDFTLACTGQAAGQHSAWIYYLVGALLVMVGLSLRRFGKVEA
ncbi:MAG: DUF7507 domain-containing protein [Bacillota bacterium]